MFLKNKNTVYENEIRYWQGRGSGASKLKYVKSIYIFTTKTLINGGTIECTHGSLPNDKVKWINRTLSDLCIFLCQENIPSASKMHPNYVIYIVHFDRNAFFGF